MVSVFGILLITILFTGIAWGRFREEETKIMRVETYHQRRWYLYGQMADDTNVTAEKIVSQAPSLPGVIEQGAEDKKIRFYVVNGNAKDKYNDSDMTYSIRVLVTSTLNPGDLTLILQHLESNTTMTAVPTQITQENPLYKSIGEGYIYEFFVETPSDQPQTDETEGTGTEINTETDNETGTDTDTDATAKPTEYTAVLKGKELSFHSYDLQIVGQPDAGLLEIEITEIAQ